MNLVKLQVTKVTHRNLLHTYALTTKDQKEKFKKNPIYHGIRESKIPGNKPTSADKRFVL